MTGSDMRSRFIYPSKVGYVRCEVPGHLKMEAESNAVYSVASLHQMTLISKSIITQPVRSENIKNGHSIGKTTSYSIYV